MIRVLIMIALLAMPMQVNARVLVATKTVNMGRFKLTAYCKCHSCSEGYDDTTATQCKAKAGRTIAVDPSVIPYGTRVLIGETVYVAEDCGGGVEGDHIDIYMDSHAETEEFGVKYANVYIVKGDVEW